MINRKKKMAYKVFRVVMLALYLFAAIIPLHAIG